MSKMNFIMKHGSNQMIKKMIDSDVFNMNDTKHKIALDKLNHTSDPEYGVYRDKRLDPRIEHAETLPFGHKQRLQTAYDVAGDRHASIDHLKWAVKNGNVGTIQVALNNKNSNWRLHDWAFATSISRPHIGGDIRDAIRRHPKTSDALRRRMDDYEAIPGSDRWS